MIQEVTVGAKQLQIALAGNIHEEEAIAIRESLSGYIDKGHISISMDLSKVEHISLSGLSALVVIHKLTVNRDGYFEIKGLQGRVKEMFAVTLLNKVLNIK